MDWTEEFFSGLWLEVQRRTWSDEDSDDHAEACAGLLDLPASARILDVPCGDGRIAVRLAANGYRVTGLDRTVPLLASARDLAGRVGIEATFETGDMRDLPYRDTFDGAICLWGSLGYGSAEDDDAFLAGIARALRPGGGFVLETHVLETLLPGFHESSVRQAGDITVAERRRFDPYTSRVEGEWTFTRAGIAEHRHSSILIHPLRGLLKRLEDNGFGDLRCFGSMDLEPFATGAPHCVVRARKAT